MKNVDLGQMKHRSFPKETIWDFDGGQMKQFEPDQMNQGAEVSSVGDLSDENGKSPFREMLRQGG